jgi:hypothetical protein
MNTTSQATQRFIDQLNCLGDYNKNNPLCAKHCVLRLRCAIEQDQNVRMELLEELIASDSFPLKIQ